MNIKLSITKMVCALSFVVHWLTHRDHRGRVCCLSLGLGLGNLVIFIQDHFNDCSRLVLNALVSIRSKRTLKLLDVVPVSVFNSDATTTLSIG